MAKPDSEQARSIEEADQMLSMQNLEYSVREGLKAAFLLAQRGYVTPLSRLIADSVIAIRRLEVMAMIGHEDLLRKLNDLKDERWGKNS